LTRHAWAEGYPPLARPRNAAELDQVPLGPNGRMVRFVVRLVYEDREEWRPAQTCRWTCAHVLAQ